MSKLLSLEAGMRGEGSYLYELECIRGVAILLVFLGHSLGVSWDGVGPGPEPTLWTSHFIGGNTGVTLFFMLSGFLLSLPWLQCAQDPARPLPGMRNYYVARFLRIVPLYLCFVLLAAVVSGQWALAGKAAMFQFVGFQIFPYSVVWWTLTTEVQFYLVLPLAWLGWLHPGWPRKVLILVILAWLACYVSVFIYPGNDQPIRSYWLTKSLFGRLPAFLVGIAAAWLYLRLRGGLRSEEAGKRLAGGLAFIATWLLLGWVLREYVAMGKGKAEWSWHIHHTYEAVLWAAIVLLLLLANPLGRSLLVNRPMAILGKLSYSLYLNHVPILFFIIYTAKDRMGAEAYTSSVWLYLTPGLALLCCVIAAFLSYRLIELPFLNLKHRVPV